MVSRYEAFLCLEADIQVVHHVQKNPDRFNSSANKTNFNSRFELHGVCTAKFKRPAFAAVMAATAE